MPRRLPFLLGAFVAFLPFAATRLPAGEAEKPAGDREKPAAEPPEIDWLSDYGEAVAAAESRGKMLLIHFTAPGDDEPSGRFQQQTLSYPAVRERLTQYICLRICLGATIATRQGDERQEIELIEHEGFAEMLGRPGIAIIDYAHREAPYYGRVVSKFPITEKLWYTPEKMQVILDLPAGTLTQRTLIYAVRTHPERPRSTDGALCPNLVEEAAEHSRHQARIRRQGHHDWETRFHRITRDLPGGLVASEVCAESWPGERLLEAAIECVRSWRLSSGHWSAVRAEHEVYGYDMKRGSNGVWYATGLFGKRR